MVYAACLDLSTNHLPCRVLRDRKQTFKRSGLGKYFSRPFRGCSRAGARRKKLFAEKNVCGPKKIINSIFEKSASNQGHLFRKYRNECNLKNVSFFFKISIYTLLVTSCFLFGFSAVTHNADLIYCECRYIVSG